MDTRDEPGASPDELTPGLPGAASSGAAKADPQGAGGEFSTETMRSDLRDFLADLAVYRMPFGRFRNWRLQSLPYEYLHWFVEKGGGFPSGRLGELMEFVYRTKEVGAESIFSGLPKS
jgi:uncharacterized protein (DUF3820 family)